MLRLGDTVFPLIFMSDGTHLSNCAGEHNEWHVFMTIGKRSSKICQMPSTHTIVMVALLPCAIKNRTISHKQLDEQRPTKQEVLNKALQRVLQPLTVKQHSSAITGHYNVLCADGNFRRCKPVALAWLADCPEYCNLYHLERHVCIRCECSQNELGDQVTPDKQHPQRDCKLYKMLSNANTKAADAGLSLCHVH